MIWTVEQIAQTEQIYGKMFVDEVTIVHAAGDLMTVVRDQMFRRLAGVAHTFGLELHPGDLEFREHPADPYNGEPLFTTRVEARWRPTTKEVELQGGFGDGEVVVFRDAGQPMSRIEFVAPVNLGDSFAERDTSPASLVETHRISYLLTGWDEAARRWVYRPKK